MLDTPISAGTESVQQPPHFAHWPVRLPHRISAPATSLWQNLSVSALRYPDKRATVFFDTALTYADLQRQAEAVAAWLAAQGVKPVTGCCC